MNKRRDLRDAERAARRARRLAERAEERARRMERQAARAAERAERLAERASRRPSRERDRERSIEDLVDEVTEKAEEWIGERAQTLFESSADRDAERADSKARRARREAQRARQQADEAEADAEAEAMADDGFPGDEFDGYGDTRARSRRARRRAASHRPWRWRRRTAHLYRSRERRRILGVCAGIAEYFGRPAWEIRIYAILGLVFFPSVTLPVYFIAFFVMDEKPYYRRVTDRIRETNGDKRDSYKSYDKRSHDAPPPEEPARLRKGVTPGNAQAMHAVRRMEVARTKFNDIEQRLRQMERYVTSSRFELQRELKKISGED